MTKIPPEAKLVFKGVVFDVYQWPQKMFDGTMETFEVLKRPNTVQILPVRGDKILLAFEEQPGRPPTYTFLGGRNEPGEELLVTAKRELLEESGFESSNWELFKTYDVEAKIEWTVYLYFARNCVRVGEPKLDPGEKIEVREVSFEEFLEIVSAENFWGQEIANDIFRLKENPKKLSSFKKRLFAS